MRKTPHGRSQEFPFLGIPIHRASSYDEICLGDQEVPLLITTAKNFGLMLESFSGCGTLTKREQAQFRRLGI